MFWVPNHGVAENIDEVGAVLFDRAGGQVLIRAGRVEHLREHAESLPDLDVRIEPRPLE